MTFDPNHVPANFFDRLYLGNSAFTVPGGLRYNSSLDAVEVYLKSTGWTTTQSGGVWTQIVGGIQYSGGNTTVTSGKLISNVSQSKILYNFNTPYPVLPNFKILRVHGYLFQTSPGLFSFDSSRTDYVNDGFKATGLAPFLSFNNSLTFKLAGDINVSTLVCSISAIDVLDTGNLFASCTQAVIREIKPSDATGAFINVLFYYHPANILQNYSDYDTRGLTTGNLGVDIIAFATT